MFENELKALLEERKPWADFDNLDEAQCRQLLKECEALDVKVESITCLTSKKEEYVHCHVWNLFCEDYLFLLEGWHWHALEQHLSSYSKQILAREPDNPPLFKVEVTCEWSSPERAAKLNTLVTALKSDPDYKPLTIQNRKAIKTLIVD
jgi:hypothetical protein